MLPPELGTADAIRSVETTRLHHLARRHGHRLAACGSRAAIGEDAADRDSDGISRERCCLSGLRKGIPGGASEARVAGRPKRSFRLSLGHFRFGVDKTIRKGAHRAAARPYSFFKHTYHCIAA